MDLSIVIPALDESKKIARDMAAASQFLVANELEGEIIVVDDGSRDDTAEVAEKAPIAPGVQRNVIRYAPHRGKGSAVRTGVNASKGQYVMFADCGLCIPYGNALLGLTLLREDRCDIAHGSRRLITSDIHRDQPWHRRVVSQLFRATARMLMGIPGTLTDTQCGFKIYRGDIARELYAKCICDGFAFDVEVILRARDAGYRIAEFPVEWKCDLDTRLSVTRTPWPLLVELRELKQALMAERRRRSAPIRTDETPGSQ